MSFLCAIVRGVKHTSLYLDEELMKQAAQVLGTDGPTTTVRAALESVVRAHHLKSLASWEIELTPDDLAEIRAAPSLDGT
jgi:Arc/MetJ family transcription regulator